MRIKAYAKVNLCLNVKGKRSDGYHDLEMIMLPIDLHDQIEITISEKMELISNVKYIRLNSSNSIIKTIELLRSIYNFKENFKITIKKTIPMQAGLAGGSADAAATIIVINSIMNLNMSVEEMLDVALKIGADVPFCLYSHPAYVTGIGENLDHFSTGLDYEILLVKPKTGVPTKECFANIDHANLKHYDCDAMYNALTTNNYDLMLKSLGNSLEDSAILINKDIQIIKDKLNTLGFDAVLMTGSGSTVMGFTKDKRLLKMATTKLRKDHYFVRGVKVLEHE